jgi:hypothetical protein
MNRLCKFTLIFINAFFISVAPKAQDNRIQYPGVLKNSFYGVNIGYINYPFSSAQLEPGNTAGSIEVPHTAVRLTLYGKEINKYLSAQLTYMRPVSWVLYKNINGDNKNYSVWMNIAGLTMTGKIPLSEKVSLNAEAGFGLITRKGFSKNNIAVVKPATFGTLLTSAALQYHINNKWDLQLTAGWSPKNAKEKQPQTTFYTAGFNYTMRELSPEIVERNAKAGYNFPKHSLSVWLTSNVFGYDANKFVSGKLPIFWGGDVKIQKGFSLNYQRNIFHARKVFALDIGVNAGYWQSRNNNDEFFSISAYPVLIFNAIRTKKADIFFEYSVAGPTFLTRKTIDGYRTGRKFTFQDFMGAGVVYGKKRNFITGLKLSHFSNGNIYPENAGVMIPFTLSVGYVME